MNPIDFSVYLQSILNTVYLQNRILALTGFRLNLTPAGPMVGATGELIAEEYFRQLQKQGYITSFKYTGNQPGHDFEICIKARVVTIDVKTKRRTIAPRVYFEMSVPAYLYTQSAYVDPDFFLCVQVNSDVTNINNLTNGWIIGCISKNNYLSKRKLVRQGTQTGGAGGIQGKMPTDVYNVLFSDLTSPCIFD